MMQFLAVVGFLFLMTWIVGFAAAAMAMVVGHQERKRELRAKNQRLRAMLEELDRPHLTDADIHAIEHTGRLPPGRAA